MPVASTTRIPVWHRVRGQVAWTVLVDTELAPWLSRFQWFPTKSGWSNSLRVSARTQLNCTAADGTPVYAYVVMPRMIAILAQLEPAARDAALRADCIVSFVHAIDQLPKVRYINGDAHDCTINNLDWTVKKRHRMARKANDLFVSTFLTGLTPAEHAEQAQLLASSETVAEPLDPGPFAEAPPTSSSEPQPEPAKPSAIRYTTGADARAMLDQIFPASTPKAEPSPPEQTPNIDPNIK